MVLAAEKIQIHVNECRQKNNLKNTTVGDHYKPSTTTCVSGRWTPNGHSKRAGGNDCNRWYCCPTADPKEERDKQALLAQHGGAGKRWLHVQTSVKAASAGAAGGANADRRGPNRLTRHGMCTLPMSHKPN